jgi:hypothetical protein
MRRPGTARFVLAVGVVAVTGLAATGCGGNDDADNGAEHTGEWKEYEGALPPFVPSAKRPRSSAA